MSDEHVDLVRRIFDNLDNPSDELRALWAPDVEFDVSRDLFGPLVGGGHYRGPEGVRAWMLDFYAAWEQMDMTCEELIDAGDDVVVVLHVHGRGRTSGIEVEYSPAGVWTVRDGRIVKVVWHAGRDEALASVGLQGQA